LWSLSIKNRRNDGYIVGAKIVALAWWAFETQMSPNKADVIKKHFDTGVWDEKPTHYLMETHVL
jgi:hypothetical protein